MKKRLTGILTGILCASVIACHTLPAMAATTATQNTDRETDIMETDVLYSANASYFVTIPKTIQLGSDKMSAYSVKVEGDIPSDRRVYVSPVDEIALESGCNFYMTDQNTKNPKADAIADVTHSKNYWNFEDVANGYEETKNKITAEGLSSGTWKGTFNFKINMKKMLSEKDIYEKYPDIPEKDAQLMLLDAGLYDDDNNQIMSWDELIENNIIADNTYISCREIEKEEISSDGFIETTTIYAGLSEHYIDILDLDRAAGRLVLPDDFGADPNGENPSFSTVYVSPIDNRITAVIMPNGAEYDVESITSNLYCTIWQKFI